MTKSWLIAGLMLTGGMIGASWMLETVEAQAAGGAGGGIRLAVIDVQKVLKNFEKFKNMGDALKAEAEGKEKELKKAEEEMRAMMQGANEMKDQAMRDRMEREFNQKKFDFEKNRQSYQAIIAKQEVDMYSTCYKDMNDLLAAYCQQNGIHMVLRSQTMEAPTPQAVLANVQKTVVYNHPNLDLTQVILDGLNKQLATNRK